MICTVVYSIYANGPNNNPEIMVEMYLTRIVTDTVHLNSGLVQKGNTIIAKPQVKNTVGTDIHKNRGGRNSKHIKISTV
jgi:hypothetical protein